MDKFLDAIIQELHDAKEPKECDNQDRLFVPQGALDRIWTTKRLKKLVKFANLPERELGTLQSDLIHTVSILVFIGWRDWSRFAALFLNHCDAEQKRDRLDKNLPSYTLDVIRQTDFFGNNWAGQLFLQYRSIFTPIVIEENESLVCEAGTRLPFGNNEENDEKRLGEGAYGDVTREIIPPGQLRFKTGGRNPEPFAVARKAFLVEAHFRKEIRNLKLIRSATMVHSRIAQFLAIVTVGNEFNIFSEIAQMNLEQFLEMQDNPFKGIDRPENLMTELSCLAEALDFLHYKLNVSTYEKYGEANSFHCCHMDLKPDNILVYNNEDGNMGGVGIWKISDFGISTIGPRTSQRAVESPNTALPSSVPTNLRYLTNQKFLTSRTPMHTHARPTGTWQPPEVDYESGKIKNAKGDLWSFGCLLFQVSVFAVDGREELLKMNEARGLDGQTKVDDCFYRKRGDEYVLNPCVTKWISASCDQENRKKRHFQLFSSCCQLIKENLQIKPDDRLAAIEISKALRQIANGEQLRGIPHNKARYNALMRPEEAQRSLSPSISTIGERARSKSPSPQSFSPTPTIDKGVLPKNSPYGPSSPSIRHLTPEITIENFGTVSEPSHKIRDTHINLPIQPRVSSSGIPTPATLSQTKPSSSASSHIERSHDVLGTDQVLRPRSSTIQTAPTNNIFQNVVGPVPPNGAQNINLSRSRGASPANRSRRASADSQEMRSSSSTARDSRNSLQRLDGKSAYKAVLEFANRMELNVPNGVRQTVIPPSCQHIIFLAPHIIWVLSYPVGAMIASIPSPDGCDWLSICVAGNKILARCKNRDNFGHRFYLSQIPETQNLEQLPQELPMLNRQWVDAVVSPSGAIAFYSAFPAGESSKVTWMTPAAKCEKEVQGSIKQIWFNTHGNWLYAWSRDNRTHHINAWNMIDGSAKYLKSEIGAASSLTLGKPIERVLSFPRSPSLIVWQKHDRVTVLERIPGDLDTGSFFNGLQALTITPDEKFLVYIRRIQIFIWIGYSTIGVARLVPTSKGHLRIDSIGESLSLKENLGGNKDTKLALTVESTDVENGYYHILIGHCNGKVERVIAKL